MISPIDVIVEGRCVSLLFNVTTELYNDWFIMEFVLSNNKDKCRLFFFFYCDGTEKQVIDPDENVRNVIMLYINVNWLKFS